MSKESRRRQRAASAPASGASTGRPTGSDARRPGTDRPSTSPAGSVRVGRRERPRPAASRSFLERYRTLLVSAATLVVVVIVGAGLFSAATQPAFACSNVWVPGETPAPADGASPQPGYAQPDMGQGHLANGTQVTFTYCPPASGKHYNGSSTGPISARVYSPTDNVIPQGWIHNLEHGALVVLYRGDSDGATEAGQAAMRAFFDRYPPSPVCGFEPGTSVGPVFVRFDDMATPFAAMVWGRVLPLETLDEAAILDFDQRYGERTNPEDFCPDKRVSPSPSASGSAGPSTSPSTSPSASPSSAPSPSPSGSAAPSPSAS
ncbi:MAG: DUF3105 domain-containing protein [Candidatus Limnocylindrales bacterium]